MPWEISDHDSAAAALDRVLELAARLDLTHPDPLYQAGKADQLARAAGELARDLRVLAAAQRLRRHLIDQHGRAELAGRQQNADVWACDHTEDHHAGVPTSTPHTHPDTPPWAW
jgi:hypothetical protein